MLERFRDGGGFLPFPSLPNSYSYLWWVYSFNPISFGGGGAYGPCWGKGKGAENQLDYHKLAIDFKYWLLYKFPYLANKAHTSSIYSQITPFLFVFFRHSYYHNCVLFYYPYGISPCDSTRWRWQQLWVPICHWNHHHNHHLVTLYALAWNAI